MLTDTRLTKIMTHLHWTRMLLCLYLSDPES